MAAEIFSVLVFILQSLLGACEPHDEKPLSCVCQQKQQTEQPQI